MNAKCSTSSAIDQWPNPTLRAACGKDSSLQIAENRSLPEYAAELADFHRAFAADLQALIAKLPISPELQILDVGCGDGFYAELLAQRLTSRGRVVGMDCNRAFVELARQRTAWLSAACPVEFVEGSLDDLHSIGRRFDVVWCAQSLYSFPEPVCALRQMQSVARPGGIVAILENDTLHQLLLPWPAPLEIALRSVEYAVLNRESPHPQKYYAGRRLPALLEEAGCEPIGYLTQSIDRRGPTDGALQRFLLAYLKRLAGRAGPMLSPAMRRELRELITPDGNQFLLNQPHFTMSWLNVLAWGRKPTVM